jgi:hypothetical protein
MSIKGRQMGKFMSECFISRTAGKILVKFHVIIMPRRPVQVHESLKIANKNIMEARDCEVEATRVPAPVSGIFSNQ